MVHKPLMEFGYNPPCGERGFETITRRDFLTDLHRACDHPRVEEEPAMSIRAVKRMVQSQATMEGAGVRLQRAFGFGDTSDFDPFLLLDDFRNEKPED